jgi:hypothetical protein
MARQMLYDRVVALAAESLPAGWTADSPPDEADTEGHDS